MPAVGEHLAAKIYVDQDVSNNVGVPILMRNNPDNDFNDFTLNNINSITLNTQAVNDNQVITLSYVDHFLQGKERSKRDLGIDFFKETGDFVKITQDKIFKEDK